MGESKHTPGPWIATASDNGEWGVDAASGWGIATVAGSAGYGPGNDESDANARLIAAAPDLLAACKALYAQHKPGKGQCCEAADMAFAALAKAGASHV